MDSRFLQCSILFLDIASSTEHWQARKEDFQAAQDHCFAIADRLAGEHNGNVVKSTGDGRLVLFNRASDAALFSINLQKAISETDWPSLVPDLEALELHVGIGTGWMMETKGPHGHPDYIGFAPNKASRIESASNAKQIVVCDATRLLIEQDRPEGVRLKQLGIYRLKGCGDELLWQVCADGLQEDFPALRAERAKNNNLPPLDAKRVDELGRLQTLSELLLTTETRSLSILGMAGAGKTLLALHIAHNLLPQFPQGVYWIDLDGVVTEAEAVTRILEGLSLPTARDLDPALLFFADKEAVLVLDALQEVDGYGFLQSLLLKCPKLRILRTGFSNIFGRGETIRTIEPLTFQESLAVLRNEAEARDSLGVLSADQASGEELCSLLDGNPLAVGLAASLLVTCNAREAVASISANIDELSQEGLMVPARQASLKAAIGAVLSTIPESSRETLSAGSVFESTFSRNELAAVCTPERRDLERLKLAGLIRQDPDSVETTRYWLPYAVRQIASELLKESDRLPQVRAGHARSVAVLLRQASNAARTPEEGQSQKLLRRRLGELETAFQWAAEHWPETSKTETIRFASDLASLYIRNGLPAQAVAVLEKARTSMAPMVPIDELLILKEEASARIDLMDWDQAMAAAKEAFAKLDGSKEDETGNGLLSGELLSLLGVIESNHGDPQAARSYFEKAERGFHAGGFRGRQAMVLNNLGKLERERFDNSEVAEDFLVKALALFQQVGDQRGVSEASTNLGLVAFARKQYGLSISHGLSALEISAQLGSYVGVARSAYNLGEAAAVLHDQGRAAILFLASGKLFEFIGSPLSHRATEALSTLQSFDWSTAPKLSSTQAIVETIITTARQLKDHFPTEQSAAVGSHALERVGELTELKLPS